MNRFQTLFQTIINIDENIFSQINTHITEIFLMITAILSFASALFTEKPIISN